MVNNHLSKENEEKLEVSRAISDLHERLSALEQIWFNAPDADRFPGGHLNDDGTGDAIVYLRQYAYKFKKPEDVECKFKVCGEDGEEYCESEYW